MAYFEIKGSEMAENEPSENIHFPSRHATSWEDLVVQEQNLHGIKFGHLLAVGPPILQKTERRNGEEMTVDKWNCVCDCGGSRVADGSNLRGLRMKNCGKGCPYFRAKGEPKFATPVRVLDGNSVKFEGPSDRKSS